MSVLITILTVIVAIDAVFLILLVVAQSNKGSDLGLFGGSAEMVFGSGQMRAVSRITMTCAVVLMLGVFLIGFLKSFSGNRANVVSEGQSALVVNALKNDSSSEKKNPETKAQLSTEKTVADTAIKPEKASGSSPQ